MISPITQVVSTCIPWLSKRRVRLAKSYLIMIGSLEATYSLRKQARALLSILRNYPELET